MKKKSKPNGVETGSRDLKLLVCDTSGSVSDSPSDEQWVASPVQCLDKAVDRNPKIILVSFIRLSIREREALVELSAALKRNSHTKQSTLLALLPLKHRKLIEALKRANVDYTRYLGDAKLDSSLVWKIIQDLGPADSPGRQLEILCPFLHYSQIDSRHEMTVCGAYLNRMVLGGRRLHELCEVEDHIHCEYYQHPRREP